MKFIVCALFFQFLSLQVWGANYVTQIYSVEKGEEGEPYLVKLTSGHVAFLKESETELIKALEVSVVKEDWMEVEIDKKLNLVSAETTEAPDGLEDRPGLEAVLRPDHLVEYEPSVVTFTKAKSIFASMKRGWQNESQCYNRAHIWTYEEFKRSGLNSMKVFLFFTNRYIRNYNYHWWFHVTPMVYVGSESKTGMRMLDKRYTRGPLMSKTWTDIFIRSKRTCPVVHKYSDYRNHQQTQDCYLIPTSQFFWQPKDIDRLERTGAEKTEYVTEEVDHAYWEAF